MKSRFATSTISTFSTLNLIFALLSNINQFKLWRRVVILKKKEELSKGGFLFAGKIRILDENLQNP